MDITTNTCSNNNAIIASKQRSDVGDVMVPPLQYQGWF